MKNSWLATRIRSFLINEDGPTTTEYAVLLAMIIVVCIAAVTAVGQSTNDLIPDLTSVL